MVNTQKSFEIIVTINGGNLDKNILTTLKNTGATIFRLNGAFLGVDKARRTVEVIRESVGENVRLLLDLPGYKIRFLHLPEELPFEAGVPIEIRKSYLNYPKVLDTTEVGTIIRINDGMDKLEVIERGSDRILCVADRSGIIKAGKGLHLKGVSYRPSTNSISKLDSELIELAKQYHIDYVGLSFVYDAHDITFVKNKLKGSTTKILPKIESKESVNNLMQLVSTSDEFIIDRGDLAGEIGLGNVWQTQRKIIAACKMMGKKIYVATQLLSTMVTNPLPSIAEIDSLYDILNLGVDGVQLSEETSIGLHAERAVEVIANAHRKIACHDPSLKEQGTVLWLLGPTSSGKTTIASKIVEKIRENGHCAIHFDGDEVRDMFGQGHGFSEKDRLAVVLNLIRLANKSAASGCTVVVSALTAHLSARASVWDNICNVITVFVDCSIDTCIKRDQKGLYKKALSGEIDTLIGINSPYVRPEHFEIRIDTDRMSPDDAASTIISYFLDKTLKSHQTNA